MVKKLIAPLSALLLGLVSFSNGNQVIMKPNTSQSEPPSMKATNPSPKLELSWHDISILSNQLSNRLKEKQWVGILAITRGGLIPAGLLAQTLNIRRIETINVQSYNQENRREEVTFLNTPNLQNEGENWLVIDDLVDSGMTVKAIKNLYPKAEFAVLVAKPKGKLMVDHYIKDVAQNIWVVFPWENN